METLQDIGLSEETFRQLNPETQDELVRMQARLLGDRQMMATNVLRQDDEDLRRRSRRVEDRHLGQDANKCEDNPVDESKEDEMRIHSLGDVYIGDKAIASRQRTQIGDQTEVTQAPAKSPWPWVLGTLGAAGLAAGLTAYLMGGDDTDTQNTLRPNNPDQIVDVGV